MQIWQTSHSFFFFLSFFRMWIFMRMLMFDTPWLYTKIKNTHLGFSCAETYEIIIYRYLLFFLVIFFFNSLILVDSYHQSSKIIIIHLRMVRLRSCMSYGKVGIYLRINWYMVLGKHLARSGILTPDLPAPNPKVLSIRPPRWLWAMELLQCINKQQ